MPRRDPRRALPGGAERWMPARSAPVPSPEEVHRLGGGSQSPARIPVGAPAADSPVRRQQGGRPSGPVRVPERPGPPRIRSNRCSTGILRRDGCRTHPWCSAHRFGWTLLRKYYTQRAYEDHFFLTGLDETAEGAVTRPRHRWASWSITFSSCSRALARLTT